MGIVDKIAEVNNSVSSNINVATDNDVELAHIYADVCKWGIIGGTVVGLGYILMKWKTTITYDESMKLVNGALSHLHSLGIKQQPSLTEETNSVVGSIEYKKL